MKRTVHIISSEIVQAVTGTYLMLLLADTATSGRIRIFFSPEVLLWVLAGSGILAMLTARHAPVEYERSHVLDLYYVLIVNFSVVLIVFSKTGNFGLWSVPVSFAAGLFGIVLTFLIFRQYED